MYEKDEWSDAEVFTNDVVSHQNEFAVHTEMQWNSHVWGYLVQHYGAFIDDETGRADFEVARSGEVGAFSASIHSQILQLHFPAPAHAVIRIFTPAGREVFRLEKRFAKGRRRVPLFANNNTYAAGVYHVSIETHGRSFVTPMMVVK